MKKYQFLFLFTLIGLALTSCDQENRVVISITSPLNGEEVSADSCNVEVSIRASEENKDYQLLLYPEDSLNKAILNYTSQDPNPFFVYKKFLDLSSFPSGTKFILNVSACEDDGCASVTQGEIKFMID